jgi:hypothetical protein
METDAPVNSAAQANPTLIKALRKVLRPLVRLMIANQITYPYISNLLKAIFVEVADKEFPVANRKQTDSRINLLTGVHRKDVKRIRSELPDGDLLPPANVSIGAQLISRWLGAAEYLDDSGAPRALPLRTADKGQYLTFDGLVEDIARQDIRPRVVLDELLRLEIVELDQDNAVLLKARAFTPEKGLDQKLFFFGKNLQDHINAGVHNIAGLKPPFFDRSVYYDKLSPESVSELTEMCNTIGMEALIKVNQRALQLQTRDSSGSDAHYRINFGIFNFNAAQGESELDESPDPGTKNG